MALKDAYVFWGNDLDFRGHRGHLSTWNLVQTPLSGVAICLFILGRLSYMLGSFSAKSKKINSRNFRALRWEKILLANWLLEILFWSPEPFFGRQLAKSKSKSPHSICIRDIVDQGPIDEPDFTLLVWFSPYYTMSIMYATTFRWATQHI